MWACPAGARLGLLAVALLSLAHARPVHQANQFGWGPMQEVAKLFAGIFLTIIPVIAMLKAGVDGPFGAVVRAVTNADGTPNPAMYFWRPGCSLLPRQRADLSGVLQYRRWRPGRADDDAGADAGRHFGGRVFMGANTYIGNAPNSWSRPLPKTGREDAQLLRLHAVVGGILVPLFVVMTFIWFR
jgi:Na+/H+ antiporter NhaD/arsenite permease-like protein